jgi:hypothetical protein
MGSCSWLKALSVNLQHKHWSMMQHKCPQYATGRSRCSSSKGEAVLSRKDMHEKGLAESLDTEDVHNAFGQCKQLLDRLHLLHLIKQSPVQAAA